jgi:osmotically-inducible protein OsmY
MSGASSDAERHYLCARVQEALARDRRTSELGMTVSVVDDELVVSGTVATESRRDEVGAVAAEAGGGRTVRNDVAVNEVPPPQRAEHL